MQSTPNNSTFLENQKKFELAEGGGGGGGRTRGLEGYGRRENGVREEGETTGNKDWNGMGNEWNMLTSKLVKYTVLDALFKLD